MALSISPQHDVLAYSPSSRFAVLPDLPYRRPSRPDTSASASASSSIPFPQVMSAPTSPLNRPHYPAISPLTSISPIHLPSSVPANRPYASGSQSVGVASASTSKPTPQEMARNQAAQAALASQSYFPPFQRVPVPSTSTPSIPIARQSQSQSQVQSQVQAPLSSTNLASLARGTSSTSIETTSTSTSTPAKLRARAAKTRALGLLDESGSGSETEKGEPSGGSDSDVTVIDHRRAGKASYSQTDIPALKKRLTSWQSSSSSPSSAEAGPSNQTNMPQQTQSALTSGSSHTNGKIRDTDRITLPRPPQPLGRKTPPKTPPHRATPLQLQHQSQSFSGSAIAGPSSQPPVSPGKTPRSRSSTSLASLRRSPTTSPRNINNPLRRSPTSSPRGSTQYLGPLTPVTPNQPTLPLSGRSSPEAETVSSDADGENDSMTDDMTDSSFSFSTKIHKGLRRRSAPPTNSTSGLGLLLSQENGVTGHDLANAKSGDDRLPDAIERLYRSSSLLYLRILSIMPACWGTSVLVHALIRGKVRHDVWPWGVDLSREALYRSSQGGGEYEGVWRRAIRGDLILCIAWAILTGHFCFRFTTGLTYRWRSYYDLLPVLVRLLALQALCWPATYVTLSYLGPSQPLFAWAVIGVSTGITYAVIMWLASNVLPDPEDDPRSRSRSRSGTRIANEMDGDRTPPAGGNGSSRPRSSTTPTTLTSSSSNSSSRTRVRPSVFPEWGEAILISPPVPPADLSWWERLNYKRRWDWDSVAREVGWKVGGLLLLTSAWVFWQVHIGWLVRPDHLTVV